MFNSPGSIFMYAVLLAVAYVFGSFVIRKSDAFSNRPKFVKNIVALIIGIIALVIAVYIIGSSLEWLWQQFIN